MPETTIYRRAHELPSPETGRVSPTTWALFRAVASPGKFAIDVGCGDGHLTFELGQLLAHVIGIDRDIEAIEAAQEKARQSRTDQVTFFVADAEHDDYREFLTYEPYDIVVAHLCFSELIVQRAAEALRPGGHFIFVALSHRQWAETGKPSSFAFTAAEACNWVQANGLLLEHLAIETEILEYDCPADLAGDCERGAEGPLAFLSDERREGLRNYALNGGRQLTIRSHLIARCCLPRDHGRREKLACPPA